MSDKQFTPGPWSISPKGKYIRKDGVHGWNIAEIIEQPPYTEANAKLIAAAPDLLEAAQYAAECLERLNNEMGQIGDNGDQAYNALKDAINKATT